MEAGHMRYEIAPVPLIEVLDAITPMVAPQTGVRQLTLRRGECASDAVAMADRAKVEQILLNLLSNAVKFTEPGGTVTVSCVRSGNEAMLSVADTGIGIPADQLEAIF